MYSCVETIERSYFSRAEQAQIAPSCEQINIDRKKGKSRMKLDATDRLRISVSMAEGNERYSWVKPGPFTGDANTLIRTGPIGTGAFYSFLNGVLENPETRYEFLGPKDDNLEYHFRIPIESSQYLIAAGSGWRPAGYNGTILLNPVTLDIGQLSLETSELPPDTSICAVRAKIVFHRSAVDNEDRLMPSKAESVEIGRDATETRNVTTFSSCAAPESKVLADAVKPPAILPAGLNVEIALAESIDTETAAIGDPITAILAEAVLDPKTNRILAPQGSRVGGRIIRLRHQLNSEGPHYPSYRARGFAIALAFDTIEIEGTASPFHGSLEKGGDCKQPGCEQPDAETMFFITRKPKCVVPAGFKTKWRAAAGPVPR